MPYKLGVLGLACNFEVLILLDNFLVIVMGCINLGATRSRDFFLMNFLYMIFKERVYFSSSVILEWLRSMGECSFYLFLSLIDLYRFSLYLKVFCMMLILVRN